MNHYETVFILNPVLSESQVKEAVDKFKSFITDNGGKISFEENWGLKNLAYPIQKKRSGFYTLLQYEMNGEFNHKLDVEFKRDERIMRSLVVRMDKHHLAFAEKRRETLTKNK